ncbi:hypothetical protein B5W74_21930 [Salmonella enterica]|nr:hypothetical protein [Salmonella enterica]
MSIAIVEEVKVCCEGCGSMIKALASDYIANPEEVIPTFHVGAGYSIECPECKTESDFWLPTTALKKINGASL